MEFLDDALVRAVADRLVEHEFQCWFYGDSIGFEGLLAASDALGDPCYLTFCHGFARAWATRRRPFQPDDNTAPGHVMSDLVERTGDRVLGEGLLDLAVHLKARRHVGGVSITFEDTLRSLQQPYGNAVLSASDQALMHDPGAGVWLDCMHFDPPFFAHLARRRPDDGWAEAAVAELLGARDLLLDEASGFYRHYWLERTGRAHIDGWGRGQGWALLGLLDVAILAPGTPGSDAIVAEALRLARRMVETQQPDGHWHAMVHELRSGPESSTSAFMATAFYRGMSAGLLPEEDFAEPADRAWRAMRDRLDTRGNLLGVSAAVMSALVEEHYWHVPLDRIVPWGQGPVLTAEAARRAWAARRA
ncbi:MAG: hypothetical protein COW55_14890 [Rhodobacteraceae bacterium CG17_big_fil_post_rev_8_21_14_2_50_65_11]|nr:MAG: hypothetical protein COW55_14890 [Rhodobacteraceae bacterium CG17_big_fil_post_rev_8_21_14_2_50_65_11]